MSSENLQHNGVDLKELKEIMDDDMELIQECFSDFIKDWPLLYVQIKGAIMEKNAQTLEESAHKLKGVLRYLAAEEAAQAAYMLESAGQDNDFQGIDAKLSALHGECQKVVAFIQAFNA